MDFPQTAAIKKLNQEHPDFTKYKASWGSLALLYEGGDAIKAAVAKGLFLTMAPKELPEVYATRQKAFSYTNLLGNVIGWYISALFKQSPQIAKRMAGMTGEESLKIPQDAEDYCSQFEKDCNGAGQSFVDFMHDAVECALLYRTAYVALDLPMPDDDAPALTLLQQQTRGLLDPYLVLYNPTNVINWELDTYGNLEWIEIHIRVQEQEFLSDPTVMDYWFYFDRKQVALYERTVKADGVDSTTPQGGDEVAELAAGYPRAHAMSDQNTVPIHRIVLPQGLWLSNRVLLPLINHLNQDNALDFGLWQSNLPQLWIEDGPGGVYVEPVVASAVGYHHLPSGGKMGFLEPDGKSYKAAQERIDKLEERVYKACYLMDQARTNRSTPTAQSGISKQQDKTPSRDALSGLGGVLQPATQNIYRDVLVVSGHADIEPNVRGFDFSDKATVDDMSLLEQATIIPVNSPTFEREIAKKNVRFALPDMDPETLAMIDDEIDNSPTPAELQQQLEEQQRQASIAQFTAAMQNPGEIPKPQQNMPPKPGQKMPPQPPQKPAKTEPK